MFITGCRSGPGHILACILSALALTIYSPFFLFVQINNAFSKPREEHFKPLKMQRALNPLRTYLSKLYSQSCTSCALFAVRGRWRTSWVCFFTQSQIFNAYTCFSTTGRKEILWQVFVYFCRSTNICVCVKSQGDIARELPNTLLQPELTKLLGRYFTFSD